MFYTNSKGERLEIAKMPYTYLANAYAKARSSAGKDTPLERRAEIDAMEREKARRDAEFAERVEACKRQGFFAETGGDTWVIRNVDEAPMTRQLKTEPAAWWELLEKLEQQTNG